MLPVELNVHALIACAGSAGDVHPFIAIGLALQRRGHAVQLMTSPYFRERIERAGLGFIPAGTVEDYERVVRDPALWQGRDGGLALCRHLAPHLARGYDELIPRIRLGETVLVGSTLALPVRLAQEKLGVPAATVHLSPLSLFSSATPPVMAGAPWLPRLPRWLRRWLLAAVERGLIDPALNRGLGPLRQRLGLPPVRHVLSRWAPSPQRVICAWPAWFSPLPEDAPPNALCTGFLRWAEAAKGGALDPALRAFLDTGPRPVAFTPGSAMAHGRGFFERALTVCAQLQRRAVLVTPFRDQLPAELPAWAFHAAYVPFEALAPRLDAFVHHGGIGTCAQALAAGVPQLITPFAHDQFDNAAHLKHLGVAASLPPQAEASRWVAALTELLASRAVVERARELAARLRADTPPAEQIADWIEALVKR